MPMDLRLMGVRLANLKPRGSNDESVLKAKKNNVFFSTPY